MMSAVVAAPFALIVAVAAITVLVSSDATVGVSAVAVNADPIRNPAGLSPNNPITLSLDVEHKFASLDSARESHLRYDGVESIRGSPQAFFQAFYYNFREARLTLTCASNLAADPCIVAVGERNSTYKQNKSIKWSINPFRTTNATVRGLSVTVSSHLSFNVLLGVWVGLALIILARAFAQFKEMYYGSATLLVSILGILILLYFINKSVQHSLVRMFTVLTGVAFFYVGGNSFFNPDETVTFLVNVITFQEDPFYSGIAVLVVAASFVVVYVAGPPKEYGERFIQAGVSLLGLGIIILSSQDYLCGLIIGVMAFIVKNITTKAFERFAARPQLAGYGDTSDYAFPMSPNGSVMAANMSGAANVSAAYYDGNQGIFTPQQQRHYPPQQQQQQEQLFTPYPTARQERAATPSLFQRVINATPLGYMRRRRAAHHQHHQQPQQQQPQHYPIRGRSQMAPVSHGGTGVSGNNGDYISYRQRVLQGGILGSPATVQNRVISRIRHANPDLEQKYYDFMEGRAQLSSYEYGAFADHFDAVSPDTSLY